MSRYVIPFENTRRRSFWDLGDPWGVDFPAPLRLFEQHFGVGLDDEDLFPPTPFRSWYTRPRRRSTLPQETGLSEVSQAVVSSTSHIHTCQFKAGKMLKNIVCGAKRANEMGSHETCAKSIWKRQEKLTLFMFHIELFTKLLIYCLLI